MKIVKRLNEIFGAVLTVFALACAFAFAGCADNGGNSGKTNAMGEFCSLQKAYDDGLISLEDLKNVAYERNGGKTHNEQIMADFTPAEKAVLSGETKIAIKESRAKNLRETKRPDGRPLVADAVAEKVTISAYYGTYNGAVAVMIEDEYTSFDAAMWLVEIEGVKIIYNSGNRITVWKQT